jgi:hypothetical protein
MDGIWVQKDKIKEEKSKVFMSKKNNSQNYPDSTIESA